ncbi:MAG: hypothetical protein CMD26_01865 [Flavobacteriales bacterium]|nr:hypothetical protein [Flavobacteriales bacterium]
MSFANKNLKYFITLTCFLLFISSGFSQLDFLSSWPQDQFSAANTAVNEDYLNLDEKNVFLILNLARTTPHLFYETILKNYRVPFGFSDDCISDNRYFNSLTEELTEMKPLPPVLPDKELWNYAKCHAKKSGRRGYVGHKRVGCDKPSIYSECCSYGFKSAIDIVVQLLIDYKVRDLGHRIIMLDPNQKRLGVSIQDHKTYSYNAVLDFSN